MAEQTLRVMSYNVRYFGHALRGLASTVGPKRRIARAILSLNPLPDLICLQEVETISLRSRLAHREAREGETQLEAFMGRLEEAFAQEKSMIPYEAFYFRAHDYRWKETSLYTTGLAVLVNTLTIRVDAHNVAEPEHITHHHLKRWKDRKQSRICAHMRLSTRSGQPFHVFNTHLSLPTPFSSRFWLRKERMGHGVNQEKEAHSLSQFVHRHAGGEPFIVCGDFNSAPGSPVFRYLVEEGAFCSAQKVLGHLDEAPAKPFSTAGFLHLRMHLDHLFSGNHVEWLDLEDTRAFGDLEGRFHGLSDHVPLIGRFRLVGPSEIRS